MEGFPKKNETNFWAQKNEEEFTYIINSLEQEYN